MSGKPINPQQVKLYMEARRAGKTQKTAAAMAGMSERSGRRIEKGDLKTRGTCRRYWRTHPDFFAGIWDSEIIPQLEERPGLQAITLFRKLQKDHPGEYPGEKLRTFQRRVRCWKINHQRNSRVKENGSATVE